MGEEKKKYLEDNKCASTLEKVITQGYKALNLQYFFTAGPDEVKAWTIQKGTKALENTGRRGRTTPWKTVTLFSSSSTPVPASLLARRSKKTSTSIPSCCFLARDSNVPTGHIFLYSMASL